MDDHDLLQHPAGAAYAALVEDGEQRMERAAAKLGLASRQLDLLKLLVRCSATANGYEWVTAHDVVASGPGHRVETATRMLRELAITGYVLHLSARRPERYCPNAPDRPVA